MRRYFFHSEDGYSFRDQEGTLLPDDEAARIEAAKVLGQLVNESPAEIWRDDQMRVTVTDESGTVLFLLDLAALTSPAANLKPDHKRAN